MSDEPKCSVIEPETGTICELPLGHEDMHRGYYQDELWPWICRWVTFTDTETTGGER